MTKSARLAPVLQLEEMKEQAAVKQFGQSRSQLQEEVEKLAQLQQYSREYQESVELQGRTGISAQRLQQFHQFLKRLGDAITQQEQQVEQAQQQVADDEQQWLKQRGATRNMDGLISGYREQERRDREKREQRELDERAGGKRDSGLV